MTTLQGGGATDVGRVRQVNEDRFLVADVLFAVADGVGGHQAGEVASQTSIETLQEEFRHPTTAGLVAAVEAANDAVWRLAQSNAEKRGMGTTMTAMALVDDEGEEQLAVANVGDSRAYLFQQGELIQITDDHSLVGELVRDGRLTPEEAQVHPQRSIITRALGMDPAIEVDSWQLVPYRGDRVVLCTDGLTNELSDERIASTLRQISDPQEAARDLVRQARAAGGNDNITVVVVDIVDDEGRAETASQALAGEAPPPPRKNDRPAPPPTPAPRDDAEPAPWGGNVATDVRASPPPAPPLDPDSSRRLTWRVVAFVGALAAIAVIGLLIVGWYARSTYFVGLSDDRVAIFKGRPGGFLWFEPSLVERKPLTADDLLPARVADLRKGKEEPSKAEADRYVNSIRQEAEQAREARMPSTTTTTVGALPLPGSPAPSRP
ncbi:MAG: Stp1/IreP family PP2C-type Ser/Thr phosphatase [Actinomycetota bacterium]|nr:Stp1/IreP family PP2C-type Ser/Thr phosphatase [Actinomycetota bacterium]